jgi:hypothetical protein
MLDGYDDCVLDYARTGAAFAGALLVGSVCEASQVEGLCILRVLSQVDNYQMVELLLENKDINACRLWERLFGSRAFSKSSNTKMRELFFSLLENLFAHCRREQADELNSRFTGEYEDVFDLLAECLRDEDNGVILKCALNCLKSLAYYGQREDDANIILPILEAREILKYLEKLSEGGEEAVSELANEMMMALKG